MHDTSSHFPLRVTGGKTRREYMFSRYPQVADIVRSAFQYLANPPQLRIARSGSSNFMLGSRPTSHKIIRKRLALLRAESVSVVIVGIAPTQTRSPTHAYLHFWQ
jgi:hypothetical protein